MIEKKFLFILSALLCFINSSESYSSKIGEETGLEIPRYVSLKSNDANLRVGPSKNYPIKIKFIVKNYPLIITEEYKDWRKIIDFKDNSGWMHKSLLKGDRNGIIIDANESGIKIYNTVGGIDIGLIKGGNVIRLLKCKIDWCFIKSGKYSGWINKKNIWGVDNSEIFNIGYSQMLIDTYWNISNFINNLLSQNP